MIIFVFNFISMGILPLKYITELEYLEQEILSLEKHEYFEGEIFAMSGASIPHNKIFSNLFLSVGNKLKGKPCQPYGSDLRIHIPKNSLFTYPDLSIICGDIETSENSFDTVTNPTVLFEILSPSTRNYDLGQKFELYRQIDSLKEYILIDSESVKILKYVRNNDNTWLLSEKNQITDILKINTLEIELTIFDIYDNVKFEK